MSAPLPDGSCVLAVDDEPNNLYLLQQILQDDYRLLFATDGASAIETTLRERPDLILLDVMMPGMTGFDVCKRLKQEACVAHVPVIFVSALFDRRSEVDGFAAGGVDYICKPVSVAVVRTRVRAQLALAHLEAMRRSSLQLAQGLGRAASYRDHETARHALRMSHYARLLGQAAGLSRAEVEDLFHAAPLHDVGKIGVPDHILLKNGPLDEAERAVMRRHAEIGADIIGEHAQGMLSMARVIALTHHEKWDGSGYPAGLAGEAIPLAGRIVALVDAFDALTNARPYKLAWSIEKTLEHLHAGAGGHFDPALVRLFVQHLPAMLAVMEQWHEA